MQLPPYTSFPDLISEHISLKKIAPSDVNAIVEISYYEGIQAQNVKEAMEMQLKINKDYEVGSSIHWGIFDNNTGKIVGTCGYYRGFNQGRGELGCVLLPEYHSKGVMTKALTAAIDFGLNTIGLAHIVAITTKGNEKAIKLLARLNFIKTADLEDDHMEYLFQNK